MTYPKSWKSHDEQLDQLIGRGLLVSDRELARNHLERIGYYRLSGYWFSFRERSGLVCLLDDQLRRPRKIREERLALDSFKTGATFQNAVDLYVFDKRLRLMVLDALERIEVALRVDISHVLGRLNTFAYLQPELFHHDFSGKLDKESGLTRLHAWQTKHAQLINRSREEFVRHNKTKYGLPLAIWVACEVWDFGALSTLFDGMREKEQDAIASQYGICNGRIFASWLRSLNYLRNVCAHHSRLWNRNMVDQPRLPLASAVPWVAAFEEDAHSRARCFLLLRVIRHLMAVINPRSLWSERMKNHLESFPDLAHLGLNLSGMGAPDHWTAIW